MRRATVGTTCLLVIGAFMGLVCAGSASALEITEFSAQPSLTQAGGHPDLKIDYSGENRATHPTQDPCQCNDPETIRISLPAGFIGNPHSTPRCKAADFARLQCPADSQVGVLSISVTANYTVNVREEGIPVFNMIPRPNQAGLLAAAISRTFLNLPLYTTIGARTGTDYGLDATTEGIQRQYDLNDFAYELWGVPAEDSHTPLRIGPALEEGGNPTEDVPSNSPKIPFLINPGTCNEATESTVTVVGYDGSVETASDPWPTNTGCDQLTFNPSLSARPTTTNTDSASGLDVDLTVPQLLSPTFPSPSEIRGASLTLPVGFSVNPNAADGKTSCSDTMASFGTTEEAHCPEYSKIGTDVVDSPALPAPIEGGIYLGDPLPGDRYRIFLTADGFATHIKIAGSARLGAQDGQIVTTFENLPQAPLSEFKLHFFGAERGLLATPTQCGTYAVQSTFIPWDELLPSQSSTQFFSLDSGPNGAPCPAPARPFHPGFSAASEGNTAGAHSPFGIDLTRRDGDQNLSGLTVTTPPGFSATLARIPYCPEQTLTDLSSGGYTGLNELNASLCPAASQVGKSVAGAGAGSRPVYLPGKVFLAGPYKGAPLSLAIVTPAVSGPYDLGNVVVRTALEVDPLDAHVTAVSDPLPRIVDGIPLRLRDIRVELDRKDFTLNPTNCDPLQVGAAITGDEGSESDLTTQFQVTNCSVLPYAPKLSVNLTGGLNRLGHPAIHTVVTALPGEANTRFVSVVLPPGELLDNAHLGAPCTKVDFANDACPPSSEVGQVEVTSPLLDQPLKGSAFLRSSSQGLPDLALKLKGQVEIEAVGKVDSVNERYRATFRSIPDVPFSTIKVDLTGGKRGLLQNSEALCGRSKTAQVRMVGQNGATRRTKVKLGLACGSSGRHKRHLSAAKEVGR